MFLSIRLERLFCRSLYHDILNLKFLYSLLESSHSALFSKIRFQQNSRRIKMDKPETRKRFGLDQLKPDQATWPSKKKQVSLLVFLLSHLRLLMEKRNTANSLVKKARNLILSILKVSYFRIIRYRRLVAGRVFEENN